MGGIGDIIDDDERVLWRGRPALLPYFASSLASLALGASLLVFVALPVLQNLPAGGPSVGFSILLLAPFLVVGLVLTIGFPLYRVLAYLCLAYAITNRRVLFESGIITETLEMVDFDQVVSATVRINLLDLLLGFGRTGSLALQTRTKPEADGREGETKAYVLAHVSRPYRLSRLFHDAGYDVKTDMEFPNEMRPEGNPGYPTSYPSNR